MIELPPSLALLLYLGLTTGVVLGVWVYSHVTSRKKRLFTEEEHLCICEFCTHAYLAKSASRISKCPNCHSFNKT